MSTHGLKALARPRGRPAAGTGHAVPEERVLEAAFRIFAERGYEGTTLRDLAKQLGVSHSLLNVRFKTKADLWRRALDHYVAGRQIPVTPLFEAAELSDEERLRRIIRGLCRWSADNPDLVGMTNAEFRRETWRLDYIMDAYYRPFQARLEALLAKVSTHRPVRAVSSSGLLALIVQGVGFHFASLPMLQRFNAAHEIGPDQAEQQSALFAELILAGLLP